MQRRRRDDPIGEIRHLATRYAAHRLDDSAVAPYFLKQWIWLVKCGQHAIEDYRVDTAFLDQVNHLGKGN